MDQRSMIGSKISEAFNFLTQISGFDKVKPKEDRWSQDKYYYFKEIAIQTQMDWRDFQFFVYLMTPEDATQFVKDQADMDLISRRLYIEHAFKKLGLPKLQQSRNKDYKEDVLIKNIESYGASIRTHFPAILKSASTLLDGKHPDRHSNP